MAETNMTQTVDGFLLDKKFDRYGYRDERHNHTVSTELTVTITLAEYRELVQKAATSEARINDAKEKASKEYLRADAAEKKLKAIIEKFSCEIDECEEYE